MTLLRRLWNTPPAASRNACMPRLAAWTLIATLASFNVAADKAEPPPLRKVPAALVEFLSGAWTGEGAFASGKKIEADVSFSLDLDGQWLSYRHADRPPGKYMAAGMWGYARGEDELVMTLNDSFGGTRRFSSRGWNDGRVVFENVANAASPVANRERFVFERYDGGRLKMTYERGAGKDGWRRVDYVIFTRKAAAS